MSSDHSAEYLSEMFPSFLRETQNMVTPRIIASACATLLLLILLVPATGSKTYIVYMGSKPDDVHPHMLTDSHHNILATVLNSLDAAKESLLYSYNHAMNGFAAVLEPEHAASIEKMPGVVSVFESKILTPQTTHSWEFLGLEDQYGNVPIKSLWRSANYGRDVVIGILDSGIWPESASFKGDSLGAVPKKWNGTCETGKSFSPANCNKKLIGARSFSKGIYLGPEEINSPRDTTGHGSHVASIAAGASVPGANMLGFATGTAKGGAPQARIAVYKVCWAHNCYDSTVLAGIDQAIADGVDVINLSLGGPATSKHSFLTEGVSLGAFHAVQKGIHVVAAGGNSGPISGSITNLAPWLLTVAASSLDRAFPSNVVLGNNQVYKGTSFSTQKLDQRPYPLVDAKDIPSSGNSTASSFCKPGSINSSAAKGKIVVCHAGEMVPTSMGETVLKAGGIGMILGNDNVGRERLFPFLFPLPATQVGLTAGNAISAYIKSSKNPVGYITPPATTARGFQPAPMIGIFSSVGPSYYPELLKPDIAAPGVNILAAWTEATNSTSKYNMDMGTSMASPHVAGVVALLKSLHPDWSPAAIKSSIMTTAYTTDNTGKPILDGDLAIAEPFHYGSGHISPNAAADPGLVYDASVQDYAVYLCNIGFDRFKIQSVLGVAVPVCVKGNANALNYPSVAIPDLRGSTTISRTVTHVANSPSTYQISINEPQGVSVSSSTSLLKFTAQGQTQTFSLKFTVKKASGSKYVFGDYTWADGQHKVRSPLVVRATSTMTVDVATF